ncbi:hypothetical protein Agub_g8977, partial [Astrephomene gubernaculifera]
MRSKQRSLCAGASFLRESSKALDEAAFAARRYSDLSSAWARLVAPAFSRVSSAFESATNGCFDDRKPSGVATTSNTAAPSQHDTNGSVLNRETTCSANLGSGVATNDASHVITNQSGPAEELATSRPILNNAAETTQPSDTLPVNQPRCFPDAPIATSAPSRPYFKVLGRRREDPGEATHHPKHHQQQQHHHHHHHHHQQHGSSATSSPTSASSPGSSTHTATTASISAADPGPGLMAVLGAMAGVVRGLGSTGLATFGLQALARRHEAAGLQDHPSGRVLQAGAVTEVEAERLLDALELAHGAYRRSASALAAKTCLRAAHVRVWRPQGGRLQPGYFVAVDYPGRRVVWGVRGTRVFSDLLTDLAMAAHPLGRGAAHWGMTHAAHWLLQQEARNVGALLQSLRPAGSFRLQLVGHSLGGAVAALAAVMLREGLVEPARLAGIPPEAVSCIAFAPPAVMTPELAEACRPYVTSVVLNNDIVPRFNAASLALLQEELQGIDWFGELQQTILDHTTLRSLSSTLGSLTPSFTPSLSPSPAAVANSSALVPTATPPNQPDAAPHPASPG